MAIDCVSESLCNHNNNEFLMIRMFESRPSYGNYQPAIYYSLSQIHLRVYILQVENGMTGRAYTEEVLIQVTLKSKYT